MKKCFALFLLVVLLAVSTFPVLADKPVSVDSQGKESSWVVDTGFDTWGYNYQAHLFSGGYCDSYKDVEWCQPYASTKLIMKWNDAWISNQDRDGDGKLDRHYGYASYIGSGATLTNHMWDEYLTDTGQTCRWNEFVKILAVPTDAVLKDGYWFTSGGTEIGQEIWGEFAVVEDIYNDPCSGLHGVNYKTTGAPGMGLY